MKVWQIATGEPGRDYRRLFFDHDIMINGPSRFGDAMSENYAVDSRPNSSKRQVHNFAYRPAPGDRVLMRFGHEVIGVGQIPDGAEEGYSFNEAFSCVYGWDLAHCRRVVWAEEDLDLGELAHVFQDAKQKPAFTRVHEPHIVEMVAVISGLHFERALNEMPIIDSELYSDEQLGVRLFQAGISNKNIDDIVRALRQADRLCRWYRSPHCGPNRPTEHEIVSHIVLPLFLGLGWSHQQIAVEWNKVDMACFKETPTTEDTCVLVLEAKGLGTGLSDVMDQPRAYATRLGLTNVKNIVTTDGENLFMYERSDAEWNRDPVGYVNVKALQREYVLPKGTNLVETLVKLQPSSF